MNTYWENTMWMWSGTKRAAYKYEINVCTLVARCVCRDVSNFVTLFPVAVCCAGVLTLIREIRSATTNNADYVCLEAFEVCQDAFYALFRERKSNESRASTQIDVRNDPKQIAIEPTV